MFNIAFPEMLMIGVVALIVIGPEKLPKIARGAGLLMGRMQRFATSIKSEINNELKNEDLKKLSEELRQHDLGLNDALRKGMQPVESVIKQNPQSIKTMTEINEAFNQENTSSKDAQPPKKEKIDGSESE